jgi:2-(1,2-epoxy-1,2-dihydrophenyl)acetyl-CoA isomerase
MAGFDSLTTMRCTVKDGLAHITLDTPDRGNPIDGLFCREFKTVVSDLSGREDVRAVLLSANGRFFSVGGDVKSFATDRHAIPNLVRDWTSDLHSGIARLMRMKAPVVAAVHGNVAGGSVSLVAAADFVFAASSVTFTAAFPMLGFSADSGSTVTLSQRMGYARAKRFLLLSETLKADAALAAGLVDFVTTPADIAADAMAMAVRLASGPTRAYGGIKDLMMRARTQDLETQMENEAQALAAISQTDDAWEGIRAFVEKRPPHFQGK